MVRAVQMDNLKGLLDIRIMDSALNVQIRQLCGATKRMDEKAHKRVLLWFSHIERMRNDKFAKTVYVGIHLVGRPWKRKRNEKY